jgi:hypothetical protein
MIGQAPKPWDMYDIEKITNLKLNEKPKSYSLHWIVA